MRGYGGSLINPFHSEFYHAFNELPKQAPNNIIYEYWITYYTWIRNR